MKNSILNGVISGLISGIILGILTLTVVTPIILKAEVFEHSITVIENNKGHEHGDDKEMPFYKRLLLTMVGTTTIGAAYGMVLSIIYFYFRNKGIKKGLVLGLFGFILINLLPGIGLPPNPPGIEAVASVEARQMWWMGLIVTEAIGIGAFFGMRMVLEKMYKSIAAPAAFLFFIIIVSIPFLTNIPSGIKYSLVPQELITIFRIASFTVGLAFWLSLGFLVAYFNKGFLRKEGVGV
jgi:cobalt transporter subunit CbtA